MLLHLVKKDFLIVKKYVLIMLVAAIAIPPVMLWRAPEYGGVMGFILSVIFAVFMLFRSKSISVRKHLPCCAPPHFPGGFWFCQSTFSVCLSMRSAA